MSSATTSPAASSTAPPTAPVERTIPQLSGYLASAGYMLLALRKLLVPDPGAARKEAKEGIGSVARRGVSELGTRGVFRYGLNARGRNQRRMQLPKLDVAGSNPGSPALEDFLGSPELPSFQLSRFFAPSDPSERWCRYVVPVEE